MFSAPIKGRFRCYASLHCEENGHRERGTFTTQGKRYIHSDRSRVLELFLQFESKQQIMQNNMETQQKIMYSFYIGS